MVGLGRHIRGNHRDRDGVDNLGIDRLKNDIKRLSAEWYEWKSIPNKKDRILNVLNKYEGNDEIRTNCLKYALPSIILSDCKDHLGEKEIKEAVNKITDILRGDNYPKLEFDFPKAFNQEEIELINTINNSFSSKKHKIAEAVELCVSKDIIIDEPLGCYVRPGILKVTHNVPEFVDHPKIVLYKEKIDEFAMSKNISHEYITAFVYLYQLCRMFFDRYPYGNLLEYKEWDVKEDRLRDVVKIDKGKILDSFVRNDIVSSVERPIVALAALHYAGQINKDVLEAGKIILSDEELYLKWPKLKEWINVGLSLYDKGNQKLIKAYRDVAVLISSADKNDDLISLINNKASLLNDIKRKIDFK